MKLRHLYTACLLLLLSGCSGHGPCPADRALYTADSLDARHMPIAPDTLLNAAIAHYESRCFVPCDKLARACYYRGRINRASQNYPQAMADFAQARRHFTRRTPPTLQGRTAANIAFLCTSAGSDSLALLYYNEALEHFRSAKDTSRMAYTLLDIGGVKLRTGKAEESLNYYRQTVPFAKDSMLYGNVLQCIGKAYYELNEPDSALHYMMRSVPYPYKNNVMGVRYLYIAYCHFDAQQLDSAAVYAQKAIDATTDPSVHKSAYYMLMDWAKKKKDIDAYDLYSHNRTDAQNLIQDKQVNLKEAVGKIPLEISTRKNIHLQGWLMKLLPLLLVVTGYAVWKRIKYRQLKYKEAQIRLQYKLTVETLQQEQNLLQHSKERLAKLTKDKEQRLHDFQEQKTRLLGEKWKDWTETERTADILLNGFFVRLQCKHPDLKEQEKRMCLLVLLDCSQQEMADLLYMAKKSIGVTKMRLANNLGTTSSKMQQYLTDFIGSN